MQILSFVAMAIAAINIFGGFYGYAAYAQDV